MRRCRRLAAAAALAAGAAALAGCGSGGSKADGSAQKLAVSLTDAGCSPAQLKAKPGSITFQVTNGGTGKVSELELKDQKGIILGERENIVAGISGSFTLNLQPGTYVLNCPNGDREDNGKLIVTGTPTTATATKPNPLLTKATSGYRTYIVRQSDQLVAGTKQFVAALRANDLAKAKALFGTVRYHYEAIEPVAESFGNLDPAIDARANDVAKPSEWTGFHRIEQILWVENSTAGTESYGAKLLADVTTLDRRVRTLTFQPAQLANGAVELLNEVSTSKITGEEERYSHLDLVDFQANVDGSQAAFEAVKPMLAAKDASTATEITQRFADVNTALASYRVGSDRYSFVLYTQLTPTDTKQLSAAVDALAEPLSHVAEQVV